MYLSGSAVSGRSWLVLVIYKLIIKWECWIMINEFPEVSRFSDYLSNFMISAEAPWCCIPIG